MTNAQYKRCSKCKQEFPKSPEYFYFRNGKPREGKCKRCYSIDAGHTPNEKHPKGYKHCSTCRMVFPQTAEYFNRCRSAKDGLTHDCKTCQAVRSSNYYQGHKEQCLSQMQKKYADNPEPRKAKAQEWAIENPDRVKGNNQRWQRENWDYLVEYKRNWKHANPENVRKSGNVYRVNRAAKIRGNGGKHTKREIEGLYVLQDGLCKWCNKPVNDKYHIDHIIPVSKGGTSFITNLCIACPRCNHLKSNLMPEQWIAKLNRLKSKSLL